MYKRYMTLIVVVWALSLLAACGSGSADTATTGSAASQTTGASAQAAATGSGKKVGLVLNGPIGVNPFLKAIKDGVEKAGTEFGFTPTVIESRDIPAIEANLNRLIKQGNDLVICNSFECVDILAKVAPANPNQRFLIIDATVDAPNVSSAVFREHESAFLVGAEVAQLSKAKNVGFVGAVDIPLLHRWSDGYQAGVNYIDQTVKVQTAWSGSFSDPAKVKELATIQANQGADIIFPAAAAGIFGAFEAAKAKGFSTLR